MSDQEYDLTVKVDDKGALTFFNSLGEAVSKIPEATKKAEGGFTSFEAKTVSLAASLEIAKKGYEMITGAIGKFTEAMERGEQVNNVERTFQRLATTSKTSADSILKAFTESTEGVISRFALMQKADGLLAAGVAPTKKIFEDIGVAAQGLAASAGIKLPEALDIITRAMITGNDRGLRPYVAGWEGLQKAIDANAGAVKGANSVFEQGSASLSNWKDRLVSGIEKNNDFANGVNSIVESFKYLVSWLPQAENLLTDFGNGVSIITGKLGEARTALSQFDEAVQIAVDVRNGLSYAEAKELVVNRDSAQAALQESLARKATRVEHELAIQNQNKLKDATQGAASSLKAESEKIKEAREAANNHNTSLDQMIEKFKEGGIAAKEELGSQINKLIGLIEHGTITNEDYADGLGLIKREWALTGNNASEFARILNEEVAPAEEAEILRQIKAREEQDRANQSANANSFSGSLQSGLFGDENNAANAGQELAQGLTTGMHDAILLAFDRNSKSGDWKKAAEGLGSSIGGAIGMAVGGPMGEAIGSALGEKLTDAIFHPFVHKSAGSKERKKIDEYFAEMFEAKHLSIIVGGEVKDMMDMVFNGDTIFGGNVKVGENSNNFLNGLSASVQTAFKGVAAAFSELEGLSTDMQEYLAGVLANNLGDLFNLKLALIATGKSAAEMEDALFQAFLKGKLSAEEYYLELIKINGLMSDKGIPDKLGALGEAFDDVGKAGYSGGQALLSALQAIGQEATELNISTLPGLAAALVNSFGESATQVDLLMQAMKASGINSITELVNASNAQLAQLAANMQLISEGKAPITTPVASASTSATSSYSGGSSNSRASDAASKRSQFNNDLEALIQKSTQYNDILQRMADGTLSNSQANAKLESLYNSGGAALKAYNKATEQAAVEMEKYGHVTAATAAALKKAEDAEAKFTESAQDARLDAFFKKWAGNIDAITAAANAAGYSFQDMQDNALKAAMTAGKSFAEIMQAYNDAGPGIAGQTGAVGTEVNNMLSYGVNGGQLTMNALRGLGKETKELGGSTIEDLLTAMQQQGVSDAVSGQIYSSLKDAGITTMDQLLNASDELSVKILASMQNANVPFKRTTDAIKAEVQDILNIPDKVINISFNDITDPATRAFIKKVLGIDLPNLTSGTAGAGGPRSVASRGFGTSGDARGLGYNTARN